MPRISSIPLRFWLAVAILTAGMAVTLGTWDHDRTTRRQSLGEYFAYRSRDALSRIESRLNNYEQALLDTRGLFETLPAVSRDQFRTFVASVDVARRYPGIQGIGFSLLIPAEELERHVESIRQQGYPDYALRPQGYRELYSSIIYLEPFSDRNLRAFGYDMFSEPVRKAAMSRAVETGQPALSGKVQLVQETDQDVQSGFLLYVPVYKKQTTSPLGWVYAPFRMDDFMEGVLGEGERDLDLQVYDGSEVKADSLMFDRDPEHLPMLQTELKTTQTLLFAGQAWTVTIQALPALLARHGTGNAILLLLAGSFMSLILALSAFFLLWQLEKARWLAVTLEQRVQERTQRLASIIKGTNAGTWEWNVPTGEVIFNERWAEILGYTLEELSPVSLETWTKLAHPEDLKVSGDLIEQHFLGKLDYYELETRMKHKNGSWVWVLDRGAVSSWTEDKKPFMMMGTHTDITKRKEEEALNTQLAAQNHQLQKGQSLALMAGSIAHHFNNKLQTVVINLEMAGTVPSGESSTRYLVRARESVDRAVEVSRSLLLYQGQTSVVQEHCFLSDLVRAELPRIDLSLTSSVNFEAQIPSPGPLIHANTEQIRQLLTSLVTNAKESLSEAGGSIRVRIGSCPAQSIASVNRFPPDWQAKDPEYALLEVTDTGVGIGTRDMERLFDPFFTTKDTGRGLGLPVSMGIVQVHSGVITVESSPLQGSAFQVYLPLAVKTLPQAVESPAPVPKTQNTGTLLLVDDDEMLLESAAELIGLLGYTVLTARDGVEALEVFHQNQLTIQCVVTDLTMPRMDGWELLSQLREFDSELPVILVSGYDKAQVLSDKHTDEPQAFLSKPFDLNQLRRELNLALESKMPKRLQG